MNRQKSRDRPGTAKTFFVWLVVILVSMGSLGLVTMLFDNEPTYNTSKPSGNGTVTPDTETPGEPSLVFGTGAYANAPGVLNYEYEGDYSANVTKDGHFTTVPDLGFTVYGEESHTLGGNSEDCLLWTTQQSSGSNKYLEIGKNDYGPMQHIFSPVAASGDIYVFETDMYFSGTDSGIREDKLTSYPDWFGRMEFYGSTQQDDHGILRLYIVYTPGEDYFRLSSLGKNAAWSFEIPTAKWFNFRVEYTPTTSTAGNVEIYVDNVLAYKVGANSANYSGTNTPAVNACISLLEFETRNYAKDLTYCFDNTYLSAVENEETE